MQVIEPKPCATTESLGLLLGTQSFLMEDHGPKFTFQVLKLR